MHDLEEQRKYSMFNARIELKEEVNGIPEGTKGHVALVSPGWLGSLWLYAFTADGWEETRHPFTWVTKDQFTEL